MVQVRRLLLALLLGTTSLKAHADSDGMLLGVGASPVPAPTATPTPTPTPTSTPTPASFTASSYGTVLAEYNISDTTTVLNGSAAQAVNNDPVDQVTDKSGNARHARQTVDAKRPILLTNQQNGRQVLSFTPASTNFMELTGTANTITKNIGGFTSVYVYSLTSDTPAANRYLSHFQGGTFDVRFGAFHLNTNGRWVSEGKRLDADTLAVRDSGATEPTANTWYIGVWIYDVTNGTTKVYSNGENVITSGALTTSGSTENTNSGETPVLGASGLYGSGLFDGKLGHTIFYSGAMDDTNRDNLETALGTWWGITVQ